MLQRVIPAARKETKPGGVYIGVGPEQNFTYVLALEAKMAFVSSIGNTSVVSRISDLRLAALADGRLPSCLAVEAAQGSSRAVRRSGKLTFCCLVDPWA